MKVKCIGCYDLLRKEMEIEGEPKTLPGETEECLNCGQSLGIFPAQNANQRCPTEKEIKQGYYE